MPKSRKTELEKQKTKWYAKLKKSGFTDIEYADDSIKSSAIRRTQTAPIVREAIEEYYYMCRHFLNDYKFENELEKVIWEYHSEGISVRDITILLKKARISKIKKSSIWNIVNDLEKKMKARYLSV